MNEIDMLALMIRASFFLGALFAIFVMVTVQKISERISYKKKKGKIIAVISNIASCAIDFSKVNKTNKRDAVSKTVKQYEDAIDWLKKPN